MFKMESFVRRVQDKIVETLSNTVLLDKFRREEHAVNHTQTDHQMWGGNEEKLDEEANEAIQKEKVKRVGRSKILSGHKNVTQNYFETIQHNSKEDDQISEHPSGNCGDSPNTDHKDNESRDLSTQDNTFKVMVKKRSFADDDSILKDLIGEEDDLERDEVNSPQRKLLELYMQYQESIKVEDKKLKKLEDNIITGKKIEHYIDLLGLIQNVEHEFAKKIKKGDLSRSDVISNIRRGMKKKLVDEGRVEKRNNSEGSAYLNKKYQKLYIAHTLLENDFDELSEKYESLKMGQLDPMHLQQQNQDASANQAGFKGAGLKIGKKLIKSNLDR